MPASSPRPSTPCAFSADTAGVPSVKQLRFQMIPGGYDTDDAYLTQLVPVTTTADEVYELQAGFSLIKVPDTDADAKAYLTVTFLQANLLSSTACPNYVTVEKALTSDSKDTVRTAAIAIPDDAAYARVSIGMKRDTTDTTRSAEFAISEVFLAQRERFEGTAFPVSPYTGQTFYRTDLRGGMLFRWNGTYWLSEQEYTQGASREDNLAATGILVRVPVPQDLDIYLTRVDSAYYFSANDGSNKWVIETRYIDSGGSATTLTSNDTTSRASAGAGWKKWSDTYTSLISGAFAWEPQATKTGTPTLYGGMLMTYRLRAT